MMMDDKGRYSFERPKNVPAIDDFGPRRSGRTTRIIDKCIQEFFTKGYCFCRDHYSSRERHIDVRNGVVWRLQNEHSFQFRPANGNLVRFRGEGQGSKVCIIERDGMWILCRNENMADALYELDMKHIN